MEVKRARRIWRFLSKTAVRFNSIPKRVEELASHEVLFINQISKNDKKSGIEQTNSLKSSEISNSQLIRSAPFAPTSSAIFPVQSALRILRTEFSIHKFIKCMNWSFWISSAHRRQTATSFESYKVVMTRFLSFDQKIYIPSTLSNGHSE